MSFAKEVWEKFSTLNVNEHTEKKGSGNFQLTYLSWTWAVKTLMDNYPESEYLFEEDRLFSDGTVEVAVSVTVREGDQSITRRMFLPVMDHKNASVVNPTSRQRSDARMRCLVKCLAMFGLGLYIYSGEDLPDAEKDKAEKPLYTQEQKAVFTALFNDHDALGFVAFMGDLPEETQSALHNSFDKGKISSGKEAVRELTAEGVSLWEDLTLNIKDMIERGDGFGLLGETMDMEPYMKRYLAKRLGKESTEGMKRLIAEAREAA